MPTTVPTDIAAAPPEDDETFSGGLVRPDDQMLPGYNQPQNLGPVQPAAPQQPQQQPTADVQPGATPAQNDDQWATSALAGAPIVAPGAGSPDDGGSMSAPTYTSPDRTGLLAAQAKLAQDQQVTPHDKTNGPRWWERLAGGLGAGMMAFGSHNPEAAVAAGSAVVNRRYNQAEAARQGRVAGDETDVNAQQGIITGSNQDFENQSKAFTNQSLADSRNQLNRDRAAQEQQRLASVAPDTMQPVDPTKPMGPWKGKTVGGKDITVNQPPDDWLKTPAGKQAAEHDRIEQIAKTANIQPGSEDWKYLWANGKLKEPAPVTNIRVPSAEAEQYNDWKAAFVRQNGRAPNATETANYKPGSMASRTTVTPSQWQTTLQDRDKEYADTEKNKNTELQNAVDPGDKAAIEQKYAGIYSTLQDRWNNRLAAADPEGVYAPKPVAGAPAAAPAPAAPAGAPPQAPAAPAPGAAPPPPAGGGTPPRQALAGLKPGMSRPLKNPVTGAIERWTIQNGQPVKVQ